MSARHNEPATGQVADYFAGRLGAPVTIKSMKQTFPGVSRQTWLVQAEVGGRDEGFVLRADPPWGASTPMDLHHEWQVYSHLWGSDVPVAEPLWYDQGLDFLEGRPHMVRRLAEGSTHIAGLTEPGAEGDSLRRKVVYEHVEKLAALHTLDWKKLGFDSFITPPASPAEALKAEFAQWWDLWHEGRTEPFPVVTEALCWLGENLPTDTPLISVVKGNNGVGEEIWHDGKIVAMSDFELTTLNDGALDLAFSQGTLGLIDFGEAVRYYGECVGHEVSPHRLAFSMFWIMFKAIVCLNTCLVRGFIDGTDPRMTGAGFQVVSVKGSSWQLSRCIGRDLVEAWAELVGGVTSTYARFGEKK